MNFFYLLDIQTRFTLSAMGQHYRLCYLLDSKIFPPDETRPGDLLYELRTHRNQRLADCAQHRHTDSVRTGNDWPVVHNHIAVADKNHKI